MNNTLQWKKGWFSSCTTLMQNGVEVGKVQEKEFSKTSHASLHGKSYAFRKPSSWKQDYEILGNNEAVIGQVKFATWSNEATITFGEESYRFSASNWWGTGWDLVNTKNNQTVVEIEGQFNKGKVAYAEIPEVVVLAALVAKSSYEAMVAVLVIVIMVAVIS